MGNKQTKEIETQQTVTHQSYLFLLPQDLLLSFGLGLNYPETLKLCDKHIVFKKLCDNGEIWKYKILMELGFEQSQYLPTITPLNLKYLELKSLRGVDYGSEYYLTMEEFIKRASRLRNTKDRRELVDYFYETRALNNSDRESYRERACIGALASDDKILYKKYFTELDRKDQTLFNYVRFSLEGSAERGIILTLADTINEIAHAFNIVQNISDEDLNTFIARGLVKGGHVELLKKFKAEQGDLLELSNWRYPYLAAAYSQQEMFLYTFDLALPSIKKDHIKEQVVEKLIRNNEPKFVISVLDNIVLPKLNGNLKSKTLRDGASSGSFLIIKHYLQQLTGSFKEIDVAVALTAAVLYNHIDAAIYLRDQGGVFLNYDFEQYNFNPDVLIILYKNKILNDNNIKEILIKGGYLTRAEKEYVEKSIKQ